MAKEENELLGWILGLQKNLLTTIVKKMSADVKMVLLFTVVFRLSCLLNVPKINLINRSTNENKILV